MTAALQQQTQQPGFKHPWMTPRQAKWLYDLINTRVGDADPEAFKVWKQLYFAVNSRKVFEDAINALRSMPVLTAKVPETASEEGLYLDPKTLKLYRLTADRNGQLTVSIYSETAARRIDASTGQEVRKGTWKRATAFNSRYYYLRPAAQDTVGDRVRILAEWRMTDQDKVEYVTGICNFCYHSLVDARSVRHNYGPICAQKHGLPWDD